MQVNPVNPKKAIHPKKLLVQLRALPVFFLCGTLNSGAEPLAFENLWERIREQSPELRARAAGVAAAEQASTRSGLHWMPRLFLDARGLSTNDPGMNFSAALSQRAIQAVDFQPALLNSPGTHSFLMTGIGLELPLFEGGAGVATARAESILLEAERVELAGAGLSARSEAAGDYGRLLSIESSRVRLQELHARLQGVLAGYTVGAASNPVGYSGLLGLKGLRIRIEASLRELSMERGRLQHALALRAALENPDWSPKGEPLESFLDRILPLRDSRPPDSGNPGGALGKSARERGAELRSEALTAWKSAERARFLPHAGLFGNESLTTGNRATGTSTTFGVYLRWTLFDPGNWGRVAERSHREGAARHQAEGEVLEKRIADHSLSSADETLRQNRKLLLESEQMLAEQVRVAFRLFQAGAIQALQLTEVLNRRVDLVMNLRSIEGEWVGARVSLGKNSSVEGMSL